jgi:hypothetical protein
MKFFTCPTVQRSDVLFRHCNQVTHIDPRRGRYAVRCTPRLRIYGGRVGCRISKQIRPFKKKGAVVQFCIRG